MLMSYPSVRQTDDVCTYACIRMHMCILSNRVGHCVPCSRAQHRFEFHISCYKMITKRIGKRR